MRTNFKLRRLPRAASLLRVTALAAVLTTAATSYAQSDDDIRINGGSVIATGGVLKTFPDIPAQTWSISAHD